MLLRLLLLLAPLLALSQPTLVQQWQKQYDEWYREAPRAAPENLVWSDDGNRMTFTWAEATGVHWRMVDCATGRMAPAFDHAKVASVLSDLTKRKITAKNWPFIRVVPLANGSMRLEGKDVAWLLESNGDLAETKPIQEFSRSAPVPSKNVRSVESSRYVGFTKVSDDSPLRTHRVEVRDGNVFLRKLGATPSEIQLTKDGLRGKDGWIGPVHWSPDGQHFALWRERVAQVRQYTVTDSVKNTKKDINYEKPGDDRTVRTPWVFGIDGKTATSPTSAVLPQTYDTARLDWSADSKRLLSEYIIRGFTGHGVIEYDVARSAWRKLFAEEDPKFVYSFATRFRYDLSEAETLWVSERTGWNHLYKVDLRSGQTLQAVTAGAWVMKQVLHVDAAARFVTFTALGRHPGENPYHEHVCRVSLSGGGLVDLTPGDGNHTAIFSPDRRYLVDASSRVDAAPVFTLRSGRDGRAIAELGATSLVSLQKVGWSAPAPFVAKDREGRFDIWGVITRPYPFDPSKKYPVIENIYAGPHGSFAPHAFNFWNRTQRELSLMGFYVVQMDGRGTNNRGKEFHQISWRNLKDGGFLDRIAWLKAAAQVEPSMDISRMGIYGGSAGGQNTAHALLLHGDFYKAGAADCGCYDNRIDKLWWNEQWLGYPIGPWYEENSCAHYVRNLKGKLFLTVGEADTNVDVKCSYDLRDALIAAGKQDLFEFHVVPGANHGGGDSNTFREKRAQFFQSALGGPLSIK